MRMMMTDREFQNSLLRFDYTAEQSPKLKVDNNSEIRCFIHFFECMCTFEHINIDMN